MLRSTDGIPFDHAQDELLIPRYASQYRRDSNPQPSERQSGALAIVLRYYNIKMAYFIIVGVKGFEPIQLAGNRFTVYPGSPTPANSQLETRTGLEPAKNGFANRCLNLSATLSLRYW